MSEIESKIQEENEIIKKLFNFNGDDAQLKHIKEIFPDFIKNSKNGPKYFISFFDIYSMRRPRQRSVSRELLFIMHVKKAIFQ